MSESRFAHSAFFASESFKRSVAKSVQLAEGNSNDSEERQASISLLLWSVISGKDCATTVHSFFEIKTGPAFVRFLATARKPSQRRLSSFPSMKGHLWRSRL